MKYERQSSERGEIVPSFERSLHNIPVSRRLRVAAFSFYTFYVSVYIVTLLSTTFDAYITLKAGRQAVWGGE